MGQFFKGSSRLVWTASSYGFGRVSGSINGYECTRCISATKTFGDTCYLCYLAGACLPALQPLPLRGSLCQANRGGQRGDEQGCPVLHGGERGEKWKWGKDLLYKMRYLQKIKQIAFWRIETENDEVRDTLT